MQLFLKSYLQTLSKPQVGNQTMDKFSTAAYYLKGIQLHYIKVLANLVSELSAKENFFH